MISKFVVAIVVPIPTNPVVLSYNKSVAPKNSLLLLKIICPLDPGAKTVTVEISPLAEALTAAPTKFIFDTLFAVPTRYPSSKILIPFTRVAGGTSSQYLSDNPPFSIVTRL